MKTFFRRAVLWGAAVTGTLGVMLPLGSAAAGSVTYTDSIEKATSWISITNAPPLPATAYPVRSVVEVNPWPINASVHSEMITAEPSMLHFEALALPYRSTGNSSVFVADHGRAQLVSQSAPGYESILDRIIEKATSRISITNAPPLPATKYPVRSVVEVNPGPINASVHSEMITTEPPIVTDQGREQNNSDNLVVLGGYHPSRDLVSVAPEAGASFPTFIG